MSASADTSGTAIFAAFAGARRKFCLRLGEIEDLERLRETGIGTIMVRVGTHGFYARDIWDTIRLGLEGGGMSEPVATALVRRYHDTPLIQHAELAGRILQAAVSGVPADEGNADGERSGDPATSPPSSPPGPQSDDHPARSGG